MYPWFNVGKLYNVDCHPIVPEQHSALLYQSSKLNNQHGTCTSLYSPLEWRPLCSAIHLHVPDVVSSELHCRLPHQQRPLQAHQCQEDIRGHGGRWSGPVIRVVGLHRQAWAKSLLELTSLQIVVQQILVVISLRISCTTIGKLSNSSIWPTFVHRLRQHPCHCGSLCHIRPQCRQVRGSDDVGPRHVAQLCGIPGRNDCDFG